MRAARGDPILRREGKIEEDYVELCLGKPHRHLLQLFKVTMKDDHQLQYLLLFHRTLFEDRWVLKTVKNYLRRSEISVPKRRQWTHGTMGRCWQGEEVSGWIICLYIVWTKATSISDKDSWQNSQSHRKMRCDVLFLITVLSSRKLSKITVSSRNLKTKASFSVSNWGIHYKGSTL